MKPNSHEAMKGLICEIKHATPFGMSEAEMCSGICYGCPKKLLNFLDTEIEYWEVMLTNGECPTFGDIHQLAKSSKKIYASLRKIS
jgi:hypothetical protein